MVTVKLLRGGVERVLHLLDEDDLAGAMNAIRGLARYVDGDQDEKAIMEADAEVERVEKALAYRTEVGQARLRAQWEAQRRKRMEVGPWEN